MIICDSCQVGFETMRKLRVHQDIDGHPASWEHGQFTGITVEQDVVPVPVQAWWTS